MPSWKLHLHIACEICKDIDIKDKTAFVLANLSPDIKTGWILPDVLDKVSASITHYYEKDGVGQTLPDFRDFANNNKLDNVVSIGYCAHLLTDYYWNSLMNRKFFLLSENGEIAGIKTLAGCLFGTKEMCNIVKRNDFIAISDYIIYNDEMKITDLSLKYLWIFKHDFNITECDIQGVLKYIDCNYKEITKLRTPVLMSIPDYMEHLDACKKFVWKTITSIIEEDDESASIKHLLCS